MKISRAHALFLLFALVGIGISIWSAEHWFMLQLGQSAGKSFCNVTEFWNCDRATLSELGAFASIPLGVFSALYFFVLIILSFVRPMSSKLLFILHLPAWLFSAFLAYQLVFVLNAGCLVCLAMDVCWLGAGISALFVRPPHKLSLGLGVGLIFAGILLFSIYPYNRVKSLHSLPSAAELDRFRAWFKNLPVEEIPGPTVFVSSAKRSPVVKVVEFSDFGCPFCGRAAKSLVPYLMGRDDVEFHFYPLPLDSSCHPDMKQAIHPNSCEWSKLAICAQQQNQFWAIHDQIYEINEERDSRVSQENLARLGLDLSAFETCLKSDATKEELSKLIEVSRTLKVTGTPTFYIDGRKIQGIIDPRLFKILIEEAKIQ